MTYNTSAVVPSFANTLAAVEIGHAVVVVSDAVAMATDGCDDASDGEEAVQSGVVYLYEIINSHSQVNVTRPLMTLCADKPFSRFGDNVLVSEHYSQYRLTYWQQSCQDCR